MNRNTQFSDGTPYPLMGLGVMQIPDGEVPAAMRTAAALGYRSFDTAPVYGNEVGVGKGVRDIGLDRSEMLITTKLWNSHHGFDETLRAFDASLQALALDYIDVYLIHWPVPARDLYVETWKALIRLKNEGRVKAIGVSNFKPAHLERLIEETGVAPVMNQIELHPGWQQTELRAYHERHGIMTEAWSPLGRGGALANPVVVDIARSLGRSAAQVILRWLTQHEIAVIPKASSEVHMRENLASFDFLLDEAAMMAMDNLDSAQGRFGPDPEVFDRIPRKTPAS
jgi:2,5-diketo-D-gluconate reductase A